MNVPPVFDVDDLTPELIDDLRQASSYYLNFGYEEAAEVLFMVPEWSMMRAEFLAGQIPAEKFLSLGPWHSSRTISQQTLPAIAVALAEIRDAVVRFPEDLHLDQTDSVQLKEMIRIFAVVGDRAGAGPTLGSKLLAALRPSLFPMWDNEIADAYGFAANSAGYHQFARTTQAIAVKVRHFWNLRSPLPFERSFGSQARRWRPPLVKILDEWNWVRITQRIPMQLRSEPRGIRPEKRPIKDQFQKLMHDIDAGRVRIKKLNSGADVHVNYLTDNGWKIGVFNDAGDFDYFESAEDPAGNVLDYGDLNDEEERIEGPNGANSWGILRYNEFDPEFPDAPKKFN